MVQCWKVVDINQKSNGLRIEPCGTGVLWGLFDYIQSRKKPRFAVNALSLMNCKVKETKTTNFCRTIRLIHLFSKIFGQCIKTL